jgi:hypothetical protein
MWAVLPAGAQDAQQNQQKAQQQPAQAAQPSAQRNAQQGERPPVILLRNWNYDEIYRGGWSVKQLMDEAEVIGAEGDEIGSIENVIVGNNGRILGIIAQVGGFLDIGDTHVFVPWNQVRFEQGLERAIIPVTEDNVEEYAYKDSRLMKAETGHRQVVESDLRTGARIFKATELLNDYTFLNNNVGYGWISDLVFTTDGNLHAVVVNADPTFRGGYYAYPFYGYGYGWTPGAPYYNLGYDETDLADLDELFDYDRMNDRIVMQNGAKDGAATTGFGSDSGANSPAK